MVLTSGTYKVAHGLLDCYNKNVKLHVVNVKCEYWRIICTGKVSKKPGIWDPGVSVPDRA